MGIERLCNVPGFNTSIGEKLQNIMLSNKDYELAINSKGPRLLKFNIKSKDGFVVNIADSFSDISKYLNVAMMGVFGLFPFADSVSSKDIFLDGINMSFPNLYENQNYSCHNGAKSLVFRNWDVECNGSKVVFSKPYLNKQGHGVIGEMSCKLSLETLDSESFSVVQELTNTGQDPTFSNSTSHLYLNPSGVFDNNSASDLYVWSPATHYVKKDKKGVPIRVEDIDSTKFDMRTLSKFNPTADKFDDCVIFKDKKYKNGFFMYSQETGIYLAQISEDRDSAMIYNACWIDDTLEIKYNSSICFEPQHYFDFPAIYGDKKNLTPYYSEISKKDLKLNPGECDKNKITFHFGCTKISDLNKIIAKLFLK